MVNVTIDGKTVAPADYKKKDDGTVELTPECIEKLTLGIHRVVVTYTDGSTITVEFEVTTSASRGGKKIVKTGDTGSDYTPIVTAVILLLIGTASVVVLKKRRKDEESES